VVDGSQKNKEKDHQEKDHQEKEEVGGSGGKMLF
jgi:hypothetical protein